MKKFWLSSILLITGVGYLIFRPSFNLALTGDDYLGLWRYQFYHNGWGGETLDNLAFFFTDYGPQDSLTAVIHHYFGFNHRVYYLFSFFLRTLASLSFLWPVYKLTKNKWSSMSSSAFFMITTTGLEATDWSFNMPSYFAITIMNLLLGMFIVFRTKNSVWTWTMISVLFTLAIVSQPIRMMFLPIMIIGLELYWLVTNFDWKTFGLTMLRIGLYIFLTVSILRFTRIGGSVGAKGTNAMYENYGQVVKYVNKGNYKVLLSPVSQVGSILLPNDFMYQRLEVWGFPRTFRRVVIPITLGLFLALLLLRASKIELTSCMLIGFGWCAFIWNQFMTSGSNSLQPFELLSYLLGGYFFILVALWWKKLKLEKNLRFTIVLSVLVMVLGFLISWLRNPGQINSITGRYLIVSGAGLAWLMSVPLAINAKTFSKPIFVLLFGLFFSLHAKTSYNYLNHLSDVRGIELTERLRGSIKRAANFGKPDAALVFYFEGDDPEILQHSFIFGFPVISHYQFNIDGPWYNIAPTNNWTEVESAFLDGQSLKRFMPGPYAPVKLENIYAYRLQNRNLYDVTEEKRKLLLDLKQNSNSFPL